jgi:catechol 2,3-dioxygenase-like lactoylglutathione lyase family enzyme
MGPFGASLLTPLALPAYPLNSSMLDHVSITVSDISRSAAFWDAVMGALGVPCVMRGARQLGYGTRNRAGDDGHSYLSIVASTGPAVVADNRHWCLRAASRAAVDAFHAAGRAAGGRCDGPPGLCAPATTRLITPPSYSTRTATASRPSATERSRASDKPLSLLLAFPVLQMGGIAPQPQAPWRHRISR